MKVTGASTRTVLAEQQGQKLCRKGCPAVGLLGCNQGVERDKGRSGPREEPFFRHLGVRMMVPTTLVMPALLGIRTGQ